MNTESSFNEQQGLEVIREMISSSRQNFSESAAHFLIWGWSIVIAALIQYIVILLESGFNTLYTWFGAIGIAAILAIYTGYRQEKKSQATTYVDRLMGALWGGSGGVFVILGMIGFMHSWVVIYPLIIAVYAWGVLVSGALLKFRPMIIGGIASFFIAGIAVFTMNVHILLLLIASLVVSYLIPAYMLKYQRK